MSRYEDINALLDSLGEDATVEQMEYALRDHLAREVIAVLAERAAAGGGGQPFNGGTITDPLIVNADTPDAPFSAFNSDGWGIEIDQNGQVTTFAGGPVALSIGGNVVSLALGDAIGLYISGATAVPADGSIAANSFAIYFDGTNGAAKLKIKAKQANGTVVQGEVALT